MTIQATTEDPSKAVAPAGDPAGANGTETVEQRLERLEAENAENKRENAEHKRKISELATEKGTLEKRIEEIGRQPSLKTEEDSEEKQIESEVQAALSEAQLDPESAGKKLAGLITKIRKDDSKKIAQSALDQVNRQSAFNQEFNAHVETIKKQKPKLLPFEKRIARDAALLMQQGKAWKEALDTAVSDFETDFKELIERGAETPPEAPKGSQGEGSGDTQAPKEPVKQVPNRYSDANDESPESYVAMRKVAYAKQRGA